jgi:hypothetical protein
LSLLTQKLSGAPRQFNWHFIHSASTRAYVGHRNDGVFGSANVGHLLACRAQLPSLDSPRLARTSLLLNVPAGAEYSLSWPLQR